jgi:hypothetical protein
LREKHFHALARMCRLRLSRVLSLILGTSSR